MQQESGAGAGAARPQLSFWQIWNMCFGFLGIQVGFALQNSNMSRIFETLGASMDGISILWIAAPVTGLVVQPVIGYWSDRTWNGLGRRRPYFLAGALLASFALLLMPSAGTLWQAAGLLWILDASLNISMEPFRAFVGDQLPQSQRASGYAMQGFFIGIGAVAASAMPWVLGRLGVGNIAAIGHQADTVRWSFYVGAIALLAAVLWTVLRTREYPPAEFGAFADSLPLDAPLASPHRFAWGILLATLGAGSFAAILALDLDKGLLVLASGVAVFGALRMAHGSLDPGSMLATLLTDLENMPPTMRRLVPVQFFTWLALFAMWIYTTGAVTQVHFGSGDTTSAAYNEGASWVGVLFAAYNGFSALAALFVPVLVRRLGVARAHMVNLWLGAAGLGSFLVIRDPYWLLLSMAGVGVAWCSIVSLPYAMLSGGVPASRMGTYMGIFNFFIVIPQIIAASVLGLLLRTLFGGAPIYALLLGAGCFVVAGLFALRVDQAAR
jgi:maltose/moltooligosaccharide transporter